MDSGIAKLAALFACSVAACSMPCMAAPANLSELAQIDRQVSNTPRTAEATITGLASYLGKFCTTDTEKARAIFDWITLNVDYDSSQAKTCDFANLTAAQVLKTRKAACGGYAYLFAALADAMDLKQVTIIGCSKGLDYAIGQKKSISNHAWNAAMIDGQWRLIDCAWGAGFLDGKGRFVRCKREHYFLTPSDQFAYDHFPEDPKWQLVQSPLSKSEYEALVYLRPEFFAQGLRPISHPYAAINSGAGLTVTLEAPEDVVLTADVLDTAHNQETECKSASTFIQRSGDQLYINALFPKAGKYLLRLYAKHKTDRSAYQWIADYSVKASSGTAGGVAFPTTYAKFLETNAYLHTPLRATLTSGIREPFKVRVPGAESVVVVIGSEYCKLRKTNDDFEGEAEISGDKVSVAAKFPGTDGYCVLLEYDVSVKTASLID